MWDKQSRIINLSGFMPPIDLPSDSSLFLQELTFSEVEHQIVILISDIK